MTTPTIIAGGCEDDVMVSVGGGTVITTSGFFDSTFTRCALRVPIPNSNVVIAPIWWQNETPYSVGAAVYWHMIRLRVTDNTNSSPNTPFAYICAWCDANGIQRLKLIQLAGGAYRLIKINAAGATTTLISSMTITWNTAGLDRIDCAINYSATGSAAIYVNDALVGAVSGVDMTTDGNTTLCYTLLGQCISNVNSSSATANFSEWFISDTDSRTWHQGSFPPVANGNTNTWDQGSPGPGTAASQVNEITLDDSTWNGSDTANQIDDYTIPSLPAGYLPVAVGVSSRTAMGATGPAHLQLGFYQAGSHYFSGNITLVPSLENYQYWLSTDPSTSAPWTGLPTNISEKSIT